VDKTIVPRANRSCHCRWPLRQYLATGCPPGLVMALNRKVDLLGKGRSQIVLSCPKDRFIPVELPLTLTI